MLTTKYKSALEYALTVHARQTRKGGKVPYFSHVVGVSSLILEYGGDEDQAIAGLLHDVIEDCGIEHKAVIQEMFGDMVLQMVMDCTDATTMPKPPWKARKAAFIASLDHKSDASLLVSCCDKLHNARATDRDQKEFGEALWDRFNPSRAESEWYYRSITEKFLHRGIPAAKELECVVNSIFH